MLTIFIAGGTGMLGSSLCKYLRKLKYNVVVHGFENKADIMIDMTDEATVAKSLDQVNPDIIVNLVCLSDVDRNEIEHNLAYQLNVKPVENIAHWIKNQNRDIQFIQISTDHLYDSDGLNQEKNVICRNTYATTKYQADQIALDADASVLRTNFFGKSQNKNRQSFSDWIESNVANNIPMSLFHDVYFSPLSMQTLIKMIVHVIENYQPGIFNLGSRKGMSKSEFAYKLIINMHEKDLSLTKISVEDIGFTALRPKGMMMDVSKFEKYFGITLPTLESEINTHRRSTNNKL